ncbi:trypsin-like peptidase domain-containing protein [Vibrio parahaemolyticus]|nr:trypsin-like peptidase domain-containing protein [Vibrio parahaemolyticus]EKH9203281.1 trypsin-like peptidase domain-containing protein [Vibrio parahaemolyticus]
MKNLTIVAALTAALSGCSTYHEPKEFDLSTYDRQDALNHTPKFRDYPNFNVAIDSGKSTGLGVPISQNHIATVAHVVDHLKIGDEVEAFVLGNEKLSVKGKLKYISSIDEIAVIEVEDGHHFNMPLICDNSYGGQRIHGAKPSNIRKPYTGLTVFDGVVTNIVELPLVTQEFNAQTIESASIDTRSMFGLERLIAAVNSPGAPGNSGGAIIDIDEKCVVGLVSMNARVSDFEKPEELMKELGYKADYYEGTAPYIMVGIPMSEYFKWAE